MSEAYRKAGIPKRFWTADVDNIRSEAGELAQAWLDDLPANIERGVGLCITGRPGVGKTYLACAVLARVIDAGHKGGYITHEGYTRAVRRSFKNDDEAEAVERTLVRVRNRLTVVVIDDVGKSHKTETEFTQDEFEYLFRTRFDRCLPTIVTSNVPTARWDEEFNDSMRSFVNEACVLITYDGRDRRSTRRRS
jgi:DNA replication protein DnaC